MAVGFIASDAAKGSPVDYLMIDGRPLRRTEHDGWTPDPSAWAALVGTYRHPWLAEARVFVRDGRLGVAFDWLGGWLGCTPLAPRRFACRLGLVEFPLAGEHADALLFRGSSAFARVLPAPEPGGERVRSTLRR